MAIEMELRPLSRQLGSQGTAATTATWTGVDRNVGVAILFRSRETVGKKPTVSVPVLKFFVVELELVEDYFGDRFIIICPPLEFRSRYQFFLETMFIFCFERKLIMREIMVSARLSVAFAPLSLQVCNCLLTFSHFFL
jgi:hypothetical protein